MNIRAFTGIVKLSGKRIDKLLPMDDLTYVKIIDEFRKEFIFENAFAYPGFIDNHGHLLALGMKLAELDLTNLRGEEECVQKAIDYYRSNPSEWIIGFGWNNELWINKSLPSRKKLDEVFPNNPVCLIRVDGHCIWVNSVALRIAGIDENTESPDGGIIHKDEFGKPTGILVDNAMELVKRLIPPKSVWEKKELIKLAIDELIKMGITQICDMDVALEDVDLYLELAEKDELKLIINAFVSAMEDKWSEKFNSPVKVNNLNVCGVKLYLDGALGSRGASLLEPYSDDKDNKGCLLIEDEKLFNKCRVAIEKGFAVAVHSIGDLANRKVIGVFNQLLSLKSNAVLRVEHAQMIHPEDLGKVNPKIIFSVQPIHYSSDAKMARDRIGKRLSYAYLWKSLLDCGAKIIGGSDFPIESHNPLLGIDAFVNRLPMEKELWGVKDERLNIVEAISAYTSTADNNGYRAYLLKEGELANITILDRNLYNCLQGEIKSAKVVATVIKGNVYER